VLSSLQQTHGHILKEELDFGGIPCMEKPDIKGNVYDDESWRSRYAMDMSRYKIIPQFVVFPEDEEDVVTLLEYAKSHNIPITPRGAGSNLSGSAVGSGMVVVFEKMNRVLEVKENKVKVQPGIVYNSLNNQVEDHDLLLPYNPSSRAFCTIGGNVGTKASGLRSIKYGNTNNRIRSIRFVSPVFGVVDTKEALPPKLEEAIIDLKQGLVSDSEVQSLLKEKQNVKTSSGYNLRAFYDYETPEDIVTHLMVGSVGTLGIFTQIEMELVTLPKEKTIFLFFFDNITSAGAMVPKIDSLSPSAVEIMDRFGIQMYKDKMGLDIPEKYHAVLLVEFDEVGEPLKEAVVKLAKEHEVSFHVFEDTDSIEEAWDIRESVLLNIKKEYEGPDRKYISFVDDLGVPVDDLADFISEVSSIFETRGIDFVVYGHVGEGNIHIRPLIEKEGWKEKMKELADLLVNAALKYKGTVTGEHGSGRNRSYYIKEEWGDVIYDYFKKIKEIFDPDDLLNPNVMLSDADITENLQF
jgi:FAD/FMN-containing dehydrogenase